MSDMVRINISSAGKSYGDITAVGQKFGNRIAPDYLILMAMVLRIRPIDQTV